MREKAEVPGLQGGPVLPDLHPSADHPGDFHPGILEYDRRIKIFQDFEKSTCLIGRCLLY